ncbi:MAG: LCP family protein [Clostridia bacterium]|nr:LCP family protein [Clostridia bacterium]
MEPNRKRLDKNVNINNKRKKKTKKKQHKVLKFFLTLLMIFVLFIGGFLGFSVYKNGWGLKGILQTLTGQSEEKLKNLEELRVLILGVSEDISSKLTDTIMVASYNPRTQKAILLSIPRDTFVGESKLSANSYNKINALYQSKGPEATLDAVNKITGLNVKYYVVISNNALVDLVNEIGGVEFDVPNDMDYDSKRQDLHIHLSKGKQKLSGEQAEGLVRFRHNNDGTSYSSEYGNNDYGRMRTQREFMKAVAKQTLQVKNITKISGLIDVVKKNVTTNIKDWSKIDDYLPYAVEFSTDNVQSETIPGDSRRIPAKTGLWFFEHDVTKTKELVDKLFTEQNTGTENSGEGAENVSNKSDVKIELLNGSGDKTLLAKATDDLKDAGYTVYKTGTTTNTSKTTIINQTNEASSITTDIKSILGTGLVSSSSSSGNTVNIKIILGLDYDK